MKKLINIIIIGFIVVSTLINLYYINNLDRLVKERIEVLDVEHDVVFVDSLVHDTMYIEKYDTVRLTKCQVDTLVINDTVVAVDSVDVVLPIEVKHYSDTLAETAISFDVTGFRCELNNLYVHNFLNVPTQENKPKRWYDNFGVGVGLGVTYIERFRVVPNIGLYYKLM